MNSLFRVSQPARPTANLFTQFRDAGMVQKVMQACFYSTAGFFAWGAVKGASEAIQNRQGQSQEHEIKLTHTELFYSIFDKASEGGARNAAIGLMVVPMILGSGISAVVTIGSIATLEVSSMTQGYADKMNRAFWEGVESIQSFPSSGFGA